MAGPRWRRPSAQAPLEVRPSVRSRRRRAATALAAVLAVAGGMAAPPASAQGAGPEPLRWAPCPSEGGRSATEPSDCATLWVPLDHTRPEGERLPLVVQRLRATGGGARLGTLVLLDGAPGAADALSLPAMARALPASLRSRLDLVSWQRRGTGRRDQPAALHCWSSEAEARAWRTNLPSAPLGGTPGDARWLERWAELARACGRQRASLLPHLSSADSARDLDLLRQALGEPELRLRASGVASLVGATYANLFPARVRAMVLDSAPDPLAWSDNGNPEVSQGTQFRLERDLSAGATVMAFLRRCASVGRPRCAFAAAGPGGNPTATELKFTNLLARLARRPLSWGGESFTQADALDQLARRLQTVAPDAEGRGGWEAAARFLEGLQRGGGRRSDLAAAPQADQAPEQGLALVCGESPNPRRPDVIQRLADAARGRSGPFGPWVVWADGRCAAWSSAAAPHNGPWSSPTPVSVLVIANRFDPLIPFQSSLGMARELERGRLLSVNGYGHTVLRNPSACVARYEAAYFLSGLVPPLGTVCASETLPFGGGAGGRSASGPAWMGWPDP